MRGGRRHPQPQPLTVDFVGYMDMGKDGVGEGIEAVVLGISYSTPKESM